MRCRILITTMLAASVAFDASAQRVAQPAAASVQTGAPGTIRGNALASNNSQLADVSVRLRDARNGRIAAMATTDKSGLFEFRGVEPGSYIVELVGQDHAVLAASQILNVNAGDAVSAVVKMPFRIAPFAGVLGHSVASAAVVASTAAAAGVLATQVAGEQKSPRQ